MSFKFSLTFESLSSPASGVLLIAAMRTLTFASRASNLYFIVSYSPLDSFVLDMAVVEMAAVCEVFRIKIQPSVISEQKQTFMTSASPLINSRVGRVLRKLRSMYILAG